MTRLALTASLVTTIALTSACGAPGKPPANKNKTTTPPTTTPPTATPPTAKPPTAKPPTATPPTATPPTATKTLDDLGRLLVAAIHTGDEAAAFRLLPTLLEMMQVGLLRKSSEERYKKFLAKRRRGFARVVAKYRRKYPAGCKKLEFSRLVKKASRTKGTLTIISSIDLFAKCDGREIWLADPDSLLQTNSGWKLLEFS